MDPNSQCQEVGIESPRPLLLNVDEVANILGICSRTVWRLHDSGQMPQCIRLGRSVRWRRSDIEAWVGSNCQKIA